MALTHDQQLSAINLGLFSPELLPVPDVVADAADREQLLGLFRRAEAAAPDVVGAELAYRFLVRTAADDGNELIVSSLRTGGNTYIKAPPTIDSQTLDPITGRVTIGQATLQVIDAELGDNLFPYAEPTLAQLGVYNGNVFDETTVSALHGFAHGTHFLPAGVTSYAYKSDLVAINTQYIMSAYVVMDDGSAPRPSASNTATADLKLVIGGIAGSVYTVARVTTTMYRVSTVLTTGASIVSNSSGVAADTAQSGKGFVVMGYQLEAGAQMGPYSATVAGVSGGDRVVTSRLTDSTGRRRLVGRRALVQESTNGGASWITLSKGWLTGLRLVDAITYEFTVSDTPLDRARQLVFQRAELGPGYDFSRVSCIIGGPVIGDFGPHKDRGRPMVQVTEVGVGVVTDAVRLQLVRGGGPIYGAIGEDDPPLTDGNRDFLNGLADPYKAKDGDLVVFGDLLCRLFDPATGPDTMTGLMDGDLPYDFTPLGHYMVAGIHWVSSGDLTFASLLDVKDSIVVRWPATADYPDRPSVGDRFRVAVFPRTISAQNPVHVKAHPVAMATQIASARGLAFTSGSAASVTTALGANLIVHYRIPKEMMAREALETLCFGPFGFAWRQTDTGEYEFIVARQRTDSEPADTIDINDLASADGVIWEDGEPAIVDTVIYTTRTYTPVSASKKSNAAIDYIEDAPQRYEVLPDDLDAIGAHVQQFDIPGELRLTGGQVTLVEFLAGLGHDMFAVFRNGAPTGEIHVLRGSTTARLGKELILDLPHRPSIDLTASPTSARGALPTVVQILRRQPTPIGYLLSVQDRGTTERPVEIPGFTLSASPTYPSKLVLIEITNQSELVADGVEVVRVEMALGSSPDGYVAVTLWYPGEDDPDFRLPQVDAGSRVTVRMRSEVAGKLPGSFSAPQSIDLDDIAAPSNLVVTVDGAAAIMAWDVGDATLPVEVGYRNPLTLLFIVSATLPPGSTTYTLVSGYDTQSITFGVRHQESAPFNGVSTLVTAGAFLDSSTDAPPAPRDAAVFSDGNGRYGLEVYATNYPGQTVFAEAVETAVGSGTPGSYTEVATRINSFGLVRVNLGPAPSDSKRRYLKAKHVSIYGVSGPYTTALSVVPWGLTVLPPTLAGLNASFDAAGDLVVTWNGDPRTQSVKVLATIGVMPSDAAVRATTALNGRDGSTTLNIDASAGQVATLKIFPYSALAGGGTEGPSWVLAVTNQVDAAVVIGGNRAYNVISGSLSLLVPEGQSVKVGTLADTGEVTSGVVPKSYRFSCLKAKPTISTATWSTDGPALTAGTVGTTTSFKLPLDELPKGFVVTRIDFHYARSASADTCTLNLKSGVTGLLLTSLATITAPVVAKTGGVVNYQTAPVAVDDYEVGDNMLYAEIALKDNANSGDAAAVWVEVFGDMTDYGEQ